VSDTGGMMIPLPQDEIAILMHEWELARQKIITFDFTDTSENELIFIMLLTRYELKAQGYRRINEIWVHRSELN
jgi:hypothetical protein